MALAMLWPSGERGRGKNSEARKAQEALGFTSERLRQARAVLAHSLALAEDVMADRVPLDAALFRKPKLQTAQQKRCWHPLAARHAP
jgi:hypothetical protein